MLDPTFKEVADKLVDSVSRPKNCPGVCRDLLVIAMRKELGSLSFSSREAIDRMIAHIDQMLKELEETGKLNAAKLLSIDRVGEAGSDLECNRRTG